MKPEVRLARRAAMLSVLLVPVMLAVIWASATTTRNGTRLQCVPRKFNVVPGEPVRLVLSVELRSAAAVRWHIPNPPSLKLRALEKWPVRRSADGRIVHSRAIVWQALEPGVIKIDQIRVDINGHPLSFPQATITVRDPGP